MGGEDPAVNAGNKYPMSMSVPKASPILIPSSQARNSSVCHPAIVMLALSLPFPFLPMACHTHKRVTRANHGPTDGLSKHLPPTTDLPQHVLPSFLPYIATIATAITKTKSVIASEET